MIRLVENVRLKMKVNTLENKIETLENIIKDELYKSFMEKLGESVEVERLKKENKKLRQKCKILKEIAKGED